MPLSYSHVACCIEQSGNSEELLAHARYVSALAGARLTLVHVLSAPIPYPTLPFSGWLPRFPELPEDAERWLAGMTASGEDYVLLDGDPARAACHWADGADCDLLVAAAQRSPSERVLLGSFAGYLAHHSPCPVLLVRPVVESPAAQADAA